MSIGNCPYCDHRPFKTASGLSWHLEHIHGFGRNDTSIAVESSEDQLRSEQEPVPELPDVEEETYLNTIDRADKDVSTASGKTLHKRMVKRVITPYATDDAAPNPVISVASWSVLNRTVPMFFDLSDDERDRISRRADELLVSEVSLTQSARDRLVTVSIFGDDTFLTLLSLTLSYLFDPPMDGTSVESIIETFRSMAEETIGRAPQFSAMIGSPIIGADEVSTLLQYRIDSSSVPSAPAKLLDSIGLSLWRDISGKAERDVFEPENPSATLAAIHAIWVAKAHAPAAAGRLAESKNYTSFSDMVSDFLGTATSRKRERLIVFERLQLHGGAKPTLQDLGDRFGLTRERIRQIEAKTIKSLRHQKRLARISGFRLAVDETLGTSGGACLYSELTSAVSSRLDWDEKPNEIAFASFLNEFGHAVVDSESGIVWDPDHPCIKCDSILAALDNAIQEQRRSIPLDDLAGILHSYCAMQRRCEFSRTIAFSSGFLNYLAIKSEKTIVENEQMYSFERWRSSGGKRLKLVEDILRSAEQPLHFSEVYQRAKDKMPDDDKITERNVHSWLDRSDNVLLWDRGTFVHCGCIEPPTKLVATIESWLVKLLNDGLPFVNVARPYAYFQDTCMEQRVNSESALYASLRKWGGGELSYPRFPQVYLARDFENRIPAVIALEQYIRDESAVVPYPALHRYAVHDLGLKEFQFQQCLPKLSNVVRTKGGGFQDFSGLDIDDRKFMVLADYIVEVVRRSKQVSVSKIYDEKQISCASLGIDSPEMLYSLLKMKTNGQFKLFDYPTITAPDPSETAEGSVRTRVAEYIRAKFAPCSFDELESYFVDELGFSEHTVYGVSVSPGIVAYGRGTLVHTNSVGWNLEKEALLEEEASNSLSKACAAGRYYALVEDVLEIGHLPTLENGISWTRTLLAALLERSGQFRLLGNAGNAFVATTNGGIDTLEGLVRIILANDYAGAADLQTIEDRLKAQGVIRRRLTAEMLGSQELVTLDGNVVMLAELKARA